MGRCHICGDSTYYSGGCMGEWECNNSNCGKEEEPKEKRTFNLKEIVEFANNNLRKEILLAYVERDTGQMILPEFVTENPKCEACKGEKIVTCTVHNTLEHIQIPCPTCKGDGFKYEVVIDADEEGI